MKIKNYYGYAFDKSAPKKSKKIWKKQRKDWGFDTTELYNLDETICMFVYPRLKKLIELRVKYFVIEEETIKEYYEMLKFFESYNEGNIAQPIDKRGLELFVKHFDSLWF